ncbi:hypothetical protein [Snodgrassella communis]|uniref:Uncharacterized protein n=1 Tax=Snodgrassella communis TaxID=2946699 RepID=A0A837B217_9NEIS|nr:hypothetical protein [Snodgrassella communis]KDN12461.1 hypothetical protein SALWKB12_0985 [Snodgrassella communis]KDN15547.1 hypothetical protein SALWKB29_0651 [Snodgrassella communis]
MINAIYYFHYYFQKVDKGYNNNDLPVFCVGVGFNKGQCAVFKQGVSIPMGFH